MDVCLVAISLRICPPTFHVRLCNQPQDSTVGMWFSFELIEFSILGMWTWSRNTEGQIQLELSHPMVIPTKKVQKFLLLVIPVSCHSQGLIFHLLLSTHWFIPQILVSKLCVLGTVLGSGVQTRMTTSLPSWSEQSNKEDWWQTSKEDHCTLEKSCERERWGGVLETCWIGHFRQDGQGKPPWATHDPPKNPPFLLCAPRVSFYCLQSNTSDRHMKQREFIRPYYSQETLASGSWALFALNP